MTPTRRTLLQALASGAVAATAGCPGRAPEAGPPAAEVVDAETGGPPLGGQVAYLRPPAREGALSTDIEANGAPCVPALTAEQRARARSIGDAVRAMGVSLEAVRALPSCRCLDTARVAFGRGVPVEEASKGTSDGAGRAARAALRDLLSAPPPPEKARVVVGGRAPLAAVADVDLPPGALAAFEPTADGFRLERRLGPEELRRAAAGEAPAPATTSYRIRRGTPEETAVHRIRAGTEGPTALVVGGMHGDEEAGYRTARRATDWNVDAGTLVVVPEANRPAIRLNDREGYDGRDLNRQFPLDEVPSVPLARALWATVLRHDPDVVVDMHTSAGFAARDDGYVGQAIFHSGHPKIARRVERVAGWLNRAVVPSDRPPEYDYLVRRMDGDPSGMLATKAARNLGVPACIYEVTEEGLDPSTQVEWTAAFLRQLLARWGLLAGGSTRTERL